MDDCFVFEGGGPVSGDLPPCSSDDDTGASIASDPDVDGSNWEGGCQHTGGSGLWVLVFVWMLVGAAWAQDLQQLQRLEGGTAVRSFDPGERFAPNLQLSYHYGHAPVSRRDADGRTVVLRGQGTGELAISTNLFGLGLGAALPVHHQSWVEAKGSGTGDLALWVLLAQSTAWGRMGLRVRFEQPLSRQPWLGQRAVVLTAGARSEGRIRLDGHLALRLQKAVEVPGQVLGHRMEVAFGAELPLADVLEVRAELFGSVPLTGGWAVRSLPFEVLLAPAVRLSPGVRLDLHGGTSLTRGLGTPRWRLGGGVRFSGHAPRDTDRDGLNDLFDRCRLEPEDRDGYRDGDGCPDPDNDGDGVLDPVDACPRVPETANGLLDTDGCPDTWPLLVIEARSPEVIDVEVLGRRKRMLAGERWELRLDPGSLEVVASAEGHHLESIALSFDPNEAKELALVLDPIAMGELCLTVVEDERPVRATVSGDVVFEVEGRRCVATEVGQVHFVVGADGFSPQAQTVAVSGRVEHVVRLERPAVLQRGSRVELNETFGYAPGSYVPRGGGDLQLDALAAWLRAHPEVLLFRIEGHADSVGGSAFNLLLSQRRAEGIRQGLVDRGIASERLQAIGSGEAWAWSGPARNVAFSVLVVDGDGPVEVP